MEPLTRLGALKRAKEDPVADVLANYPKAKADEAKAAKWAETWQGNWGRRLSRRTT